MTINTQKIVIVAGGPTGPTGTIKGVNILGAFTGPTGTFAQWAQATGNTGPHGTFETVYNIGPTGIKGEHKTVIIPGFSGGGGGGGLAFDPTFLTAGVLLSNGNRTATQPNSGPGVTRATLGRSTAGLRYFELQNVTALNPNTCCGVCTANYGLGESQNTQNAFLSIAGGTLVNGIGEHQASVNYTPYGGGHTSCIAIDLSGQIWFRTDGGVWNGSSSNDPGTGVGGWSNGGPFPGDGQSGLVYPFCSLLGVGDNMTLAANASNILFPMPAGYTAWGD